MGRASGRGSGRGMLVGECDGEPWKYTFEWEHQERSHLIIMPLCD